MAVAS